MVDKEIMIEIRDVMRRMHYAIPVDLGYAEKPREDSLPARQLCRRMVASFIVNSLPPGEFDHYRVGLAREFRGNLDCSGLMAATLNDR